MTEQNQKTIVSKYTGIRELQVLDKKYSYHVFKPVESDTDIAEIKIRYDNPSIVDIVLELQKKYELSWVENESQPKQTFNQVDAIAVVIQEEDNDNNNNTKKAKDCGACLERITYSLATKCQDWETNRKSKIEELKKGNCFHEKDVLPPALDFEHNKVMEHKKTHSKCQKEYVSRKSNPFGDEKKLTHNCSQKPNNNDNNDDDSGDNNNKIAEVSTVRKYYKDNDIKSLEWDEESGKLVIIYKSNKPKSELDNLSEELQEIKNYLKKNGHKSGQGKKYSLNDSDWERNQFEEQKNKTNLNSPWILAGAIGLFVIVLIVVIGLVFKD